jgi:hypothetical protein
VKVTKFLKMPRGRRSCRRPKRFLQEVERFTSQLPWILDALRSQHLAFWREKPSHYPKMLAIESQNGPGFDSGTEEALLAPENHHLPVEMVAATNGSFAKLDASLKVRPQKP